MCSGQVYTVDESFHARDIVTLVQGGDQVYLSILSMAGSLTALGSASHPY